MDIIIGRVIRHLAPTPPVYGSSVADTPQRAMLEINLIIQDFMWEGKTPNISHNTLIQSIQNGGLKLCHFDVKVKAFKIS